MKAWSLVGPNDASKEERRWPHGYGIPAWRSEPLFYADQVGLPTVCEAILRYRDRFGDDFWSTAPLMEELARSGNDFFPSSVTAPTIVC